MIDSMQVATSTTLSHAGIMIVTIAESESLPECVIRLVRSLTKFRDLEDECVVLVEPLTTDNRLSNVRIQFRGAPSNSGTREFGRLFVVTKSLTLIKRVNPIATMSFLSDALDRIKSLSL